MNEAWCSGLKMVSLLQIQKRGAVVQVKVLGIMALIDEGTHVFLFCHACSQVFSAVSLMAFSIFFYVELFFILHLKFTQMNNHIFIIVIV